MRWQWESGTFDEVLHKHGRWSHEFASNRVLYLSNRQAFAILRGYDCRRDAGYLGYYLSAGFVAAAFAVAICVFKIS